MLSFKDKCIDAGLRMTAQRAVIAETIEESLDHPDVETIYQRASERDNTVSIATVYRTIGIFEQAGLIQRIDVNNEGRARYEIKREPHEHLVDVETGQIHEFQSRRLESLIREIASEMGFELTEHKLEIFGRKNGREKCRCYQIKVY